MRTFISQPLVNSVLSEYVILSLSFRHVQKIPANVCSHIAYFPSAPPFTSCAEQVWKTILTSIQTDQLHPIYNSTVVCFGVKYYSHTLIWSSIIWPEGASASTYSFTAKHWGMSLLTVCTYLIINVAPSCHLPEACGMFVC